MNSVVFLRQGERLHVKAHYGPILLDFGDGPIGRGWVTGRAFVDQLPIQVHDLQNSARDFPDGSKMELRTQVRTTLSVPLLTEDDAIGALTIRRNEVKPFTERQVELVNTFAAQAVIAIENARLLNELRQRTDDLSEIIRTTDRNVGGLESHLKHTGRTWACVSGHSGKRDTDLRGAVRHHISMRRRCRPVRWDA